MYKLIVLFFLPFLAPFTYAETISVYIYHKQPPFIIGNLSNKDGLMFDVVNLLNEHDASGIQFEVQARPKPRLNAELKDWINNKCTKKSNIACSNNWVVFWVTPQWGWGEKAEEHFLWLDLFQDSDEIISLVKDKVNYDDLRTIHGKTFGAIRGHNYPPIIEKLFASKQLTRQDGTQESVILQRLIHKRIDVTILQQSTINYLLEHDPVTKKGKTKLYISPTPLKSFMLKVMIPPNRPDLKEIIKLISQKDIWKTTFKQYGITL